jgi:hypothetical protein
MVQMVRMGANPSYKLPAEKEQAAALAPVWASIKKQAIRTVPYVVAVENAKNSGGMYAILAEEKPEASVGAIRMPEDMTADELKLTALQLGVDLRKPMKKADLVAAVRRAMDAVILMDDDSEDET